MVQKSTALQKATTEQQAELKSLETVRSRVEAAQRAAIAAEDLVKLGADAEAEQVAKTMRGKEKVFTEQIPALEKKVAEKTQAVAAATSARDQATQAVQAAQAKVTELQPAYVAAEQGRQKGRKEFQQAKREAAKQLREFQRWQGYEAYFAKLQRTHEQQALFTKSQSTLQEVEQALATIQLAWTQANALQQQKQSAQRSLTELVASKTASSKTMESRVVDLLAAISETEKAMKLMSQGDALRRSIELMLGEEALKRSEWSRTVQELQQLDEQLLVTKRDLQSIQVELEQATARQKEMFETAEKHRQELKRLQTAFETSLAESSKAAETLALQRAHSFDQHAVRPLTPEQLCWSLLRATGIWDRHVQVELAELEKKTPTPEEKKVDAAWARERNHAATRQAFQKLRGNVDIFIRLYGAAPGQSESDFFATAEQALFNANAGTIMSWGAPAGNNVTAQMIAATDNATLAKLLYEGYFNRLPSAEEVAEIQKYLESRSQDRAVAIQELVWAVLSSAEFRFYH